MSSRAVPTFNVGILKAALALNGGCLYFKEQNAIGVLAEQRKNRFGRRISGASRSS
jgi:hypothetical protein